MEFQGHYDEIPLTVDFNPADSEYFLFKAIFNPFEKVWLDI